MKLKIPTGLALALMLTFAVVSNSQAADKIGVILMHGKWGTTAPKSPVVILAKSLRSEGFLVVTPEMPWSRDRQYDKDYEESMAEIDKVVAKLKADGATKIVVGGHSMGANAALGYGARHNGLAGVLAIGPGHVPEIVFWKTKLKDDIAKAHKMVAAGNGSQQARFKDLNQGEKKTLNIPASRYLSWFDPDGPSPMPKNAANLKPGTPLMWIHGENDKGNVKRGKGYIFDKAPPHPKSTYVVIGGGHKATPTRGSKNIIDWLKTL